MTYSFTKRLEPNDTVRYASYAHNDGASAIAHNPHYVRRCGVGRKPNRGSQKKE